MKKILLRMLAVLLAAVMLLPAASFADGLPAVSGDSALSDTEESIPVLSDGRRDGDFLITADNPVISVEIQDTKTEYKVGDLISGVKVLVVFADGTTLYLFGGEGDCVITLNGNGTPNRALVLTDTS